MSDFASYIGMATGSVSLAMLVYRFGYKDSKVDAYIKKASDDDEKYPIAEIATQVKTMWDVYVVSALHDRRDLASHQSPLTITEEGEAMIPEDIKQVLLVYNVRPGQVHSASWMVLKCIGLENIERLAVKINLPVPITLALLSVYYMKYHPECKLTEPACVTIS
jgi:hypothetical protein